MTSPLIGCRKRTRRKVKMPSHSPPTPADEPINISSTLQQRISAQQGTVIKLVTNSFLLPSYPDKKHLPTIIEERKTDTERTH